MGLRPTLPPPNMTGPLVVGVPHVADGALVEPIRLPPGLVFTPDIRVDRLSFNA